ncbi:uncharacterized protein [Delphinus delphis]|uniref:uncharacterized protein n=1 Tax=Delphinus delphis TaxID=9728 RepID=UPI0028C4B32D|nr:uncharacterized protein LOC132430229 [Delphinus delphis]
MAAQREGKDGAHHKREGEGDTDLALSSPFSSNFAGSGLPLGLPAARRRTCRRTHSAECHQRCRERVGVGSGGGRTPDPQAGTADSDHREERFSQIPVPSSFEPWPREGSPGGSGQAPRELGGDPAALLQAETPSPPPPSWGWEVVKGGAACPCRRERGAEENRLSGAGKGAQLPRGRGLEVTMPPPRGPRNLVRPHRRRDKTRSRPGKGAVFSPAHPKGK